MSDEAQTETARAKQSGTEHDELRTLLESGEASDGVHTHNELYDYRMLYNAHAANGWHAAGIPVVKSWRHSDGELCFGGGWVRCRGHPFNGTDQQPLRSRRLGSLPDSRSRSPTEVRRPHPGRGSGQTPPRSGRT